MESLQDELTDRALSAAVSGDLNQASKAVDRAALAGAPADLLETLLGLAHFYSGQVDAAITHLETSVERNPTNSSAWTVLFWAYGLGGQFAKQSAAVQHKQEYRVDPRTDYEALFVLQGLVHTGASKDEIIARLTDLIEKHSRWHIAYVIRAEAWCEKGTESKDLAAFNRAIDDSETAVGLLPDNPFVLGVALNTYINAIQLNEFSKSTEVSVASVASCSRW